MRVYLPTTLADLPDLRVKRGIPAGAGCAVTAGLREWYADGDEDELEYVALQHAARLSLDLLAQKPSAPRRRVVLAADVPDAEISAQPLGVGDDRAAVEMRTQLPWTALRAIHVDDPDSEPLVRATLDAPDDEVRLGDLEDRDLLWYGVQEIDDLL